MRIYSDLCICLIITILFVQQWTILVCVKAPESGLVRFIIIGLPYVALLLLGRTHKVVPVEKPHTEEKDESL